MTLPDSPPSDADETGEPPEPAVPRRRDRRPVDGMAYDAFISYSRYNSDVADKIERDLEKYPLPRDIRKQLGRRHLNVFRDVSDMTGNRLDPALELHLVNSRKLVVLCSPAARRSHYVGLEIDRFAELRNAENIVPVLVDGGADNDPHVDESHWAFPDALKEVLGTDPLAADLSEAWNTKGRRAKMRRGSPWVQLVAGIVDSTTDDLTERIAKSERHRLQAIIAIIAVVLVTAGLAVVQKNKADVSYRDAVAARLADHSRSLLTGNGPPDVVRAIQEALASQNLAPAADPGTLLRALALTPDVRKIIVTGRPLYSGMDVVPEAIDIRRINPVYSVAVSPDGRTIATSGTQVRLWDADTGKRAASFDTTLLDMSVAFRPDGQRIVTGGGYLQIWDTAGNPIGGPLEGHQGAINSVAFSPDGLRIVSGGTDGTVRLWNAESRTEIGVPMTGHDGGVKSVAFSPDGKYIASGGDDGTVRTWITDEQLPVGQPVVSGAEVNAVAWLPDNLRIVSGDNKGHILLSEPAQGKPGNEMASGGQPVMAVAVSPDGRQLVTSGMDPAVTMWNLNSGKEIGAAGGHTAMVTSLTFSGDGKSVVSSSLDGTVRIWNTDAHHSGGHRVIGPGSTDGKPPFPKSVAITPDSQHMVAGYEDGTLQVFDTITNRAVGSPMRGHRGGILVAKFSPDGHRIASAGVDNTVRLWNVDTGLQIGEPRAGHSANIVDLVFAPDGRRVLSTSDDNTIRVWDVDSGSEVGAPLRGYDPYYGNATFSPDGRVIAAGGSGNTVRLWDAETGAQIGDPLTGHKDHVTRVAFSPNGLRIITISLDSMRVWDGRTRQLIGEPHLDSNLFTSLAVSPDGTYFVTGGSKSMQRWNPDTGEPIGRPMTAHTDGIGDIDITADSRFIVSGSLDHTMRFWDAATDRPVGDPISAGTDSVADVSVSSDDRRVLTLNVGPGDSLSAWIWPGPAAWHDDLCDKLTRNMSRSQWSQWVAPDIDYRQLCPGLDELPNDW